MAGYLGEVIVDINTHSEFKRYKTSDWIIYFIEAYGQIDGSHHKTWVLDQVARIALGNKIIVKLASWDNGESEYRVSLSDEEADGYKLWKEHMLGEYDDKNDEYEYGYDTGIAP